MAGHIIESFIAMLDKEIDDVDEGWWNVHLIKSEFHH